MPFSHSFFWTHKNLFVIFFPQLTILCDSNTALSSYLSGTGDLVFLHELFHSFGATHEPTGLMVASVCTFIPLILLNTRLMQEQDDGRCVINSSLTMFVSLHRTLAAPSSPVRFRRICVSTQRPCPACLLQHLLTSLCLGSNQVNQSSMMIYPHLFKP